MIGRNDFPQIFRVHACRQRRRAHKVREHHRHLAAFGAVFWMRVWRSCCGCCVNGRRLTAPLVTQRSDGVQQLHAVPNRGDAKLLQGLASGPEEPSRLCHSRGMPPRTVRGQGSAARPRRPFRCPKLRVAAHHRAVRAECPGGPEGGRQALRCQSVPLSKHSTPVQISVST